MTAALVASAALAATGCGGDADPAAGQEATAGLFGGVPLRRATCAEWNDADVETRLGVLADFRTLRGDQITGRGYRGYGTVLEDDLAYDLFESRCKIPNAESYLLFKLYSFAAGFVGTAPE